MENVRARNQLIKWKSCDSTGDCVSTKLQVRRVDMYVIIEREEKFQDFSRAELPLVGQSCFLLHSCIKYNVIGIREACDFFVVGFCCLVLKKWF